MEEIEDKPARTEHHIFTLDAGGDRIVPPSSRSQESTTAARY